MNVNWRAAKAMAVICPLTILTACAASTAHVEPVHLPEAPAFMAPVAPPALAKGENAKSALARSRASLGQANSRLAQSRAWYEGVRTNFQSQ